MVAFIAINLVPIHMALAFNSDCYTVQTAVVTDLQVEFQLVIQRLEVLKAVVLLT